MFFKKVLCVCTAAAAVILLGGTAYATVPAVACPGSPQRCDVQLANQAGAHLVLGNHNGDAILNTSNSNQTQRWDIYRANDGNFIIFNNGTNNVLARGGGCTTNGIQLMFCAVVQPESNLSPLPSSQEWIELRTNPIVFESAQSGGRCLDNPGADAPPGARAGLFPCNTTDTAEQWLG